MTKQMIEVSTKSTPRTTTAQVGMRRKSEKFSGISPIAKAGASSRRTPATNENPKAKAESTNLLKSSGFFLGAALPILIYATA